MVDTEAASLPKAAPPADRAVYRPPPAPPTVSRERAALEVAVTLCAGVLPWTAWGAADLVWDTERLWKAFPFAYRYAVAAVEHALLAVPLLHLLLTAPEGRAAVGLPPFAWKRDLGLAAGLWVAVEVYGHLAVWLLDDLGLIGWSQERLIPRGATVVEYAAFVANALASAVCVALLVGVLAARLPAVIGSRYAAPPCIAVALALMTVGSPSSHAVFALCEGLAFGATVLVFRRVWPVALTILGIEAFHTVRMLA